MALPITKRNKAWAEHSFGLTSHQLKKYTNAQGLVSVTVIDSLLSDIVRDIQSIKQHLGLKNTAIHENGDLLAELLEHLAEGELNKHVSKKKKTDSEFAMLCALLANITASELVALQEFWAVPYTAGQIAQMLHSTAQSDTKQPPDDYLRAIESLRWISTSPVTADKIPYCR